MSIVLTPRRSLTPFNCKCGGVLNPPTTARRPHSITRHGDTRVDPYYWLMDRDNEEVLSHLREENAYHAAVLEPLKALEDQLYLEIKDRVDETDISVPVRKGAWWYFERTREGLNYPISARVPTRGDDLTPPVIDPETTFEGEQVILDENLEAADHEFLSVGVLALSPDETWVAVGTDFDGNERHHLSVRPLAGQEPIADTVEDVYYGFAWANDSRHFLYTRVDEANRPWQVWRHELGTSSDDDVLVYQEDDAQYLVSVGRSRDDRMIIVSTSSSMTTEVRFVSADEPTGQLSVLEERRLGVEYGVEHFSNAGGDGWWLKITNEGATDFRLLARPVGGDEWREIVPERPGCRLDGVDAFDSFLALSERENGCAALRLIPLLADVDPFGETLLERSALVEGGAFPNTVVLSSNPNFVTSQLRVLITSLTTPRLVADVIVETGERIVRKQQRVVGGYDEAAYATGRLWVRASDGVSVPVSVVVRRDLVDEDPDGTLHPRQPVPVLLYGYGSYEISADPTFSSIRLSWLERGAAFVIAHVRGGGEMGRSWYEMGRLAQKPSTFSDFLSVARWLVATGWTTPEQLAARGASAGGLLMGACINAAPELFHAIVAEVPFVDVVTTMLDESLPLTVGEWEEWGNPGASATSYRTMTGYSPYDNVREQDDDASPVLYPHLYVTAGLNDTRVGFWEPAKWVLKLRDANPSNQVVLKTELGAGHGGVSGRYDAWRDEAQIVAWLLNEIGPSPSHAEP